MTPHSRLFQQQGAREGWKGGPTLREGERESSEEREVGGWEVTEGRGRDIPLPPRFLSSRPGSLLLPAFLQILVLAFEGAAARGDRVGGILHHFVLFPIQHLAEEPEDGVEASPGGQLMPLCAWERHTNIISLKGT